VLVSGSPTVTSEPLSAGFFIWLEPVVTPLLSATALLRI